MQRIYIYVCRLFVLLTEHLDVEKILELQKEVFTNCQQYIVNHLSPDDVVDIMISKRLIGDSASQQLCLPIKTTKERNRIIVNELSRGGPGAFEKFCAILKKNRRMKHIADHLEKGNLSVCTNISDVNLLYYT